MEIKILFSTSKGIDPKFGIITIGKYSVEPIGMTSSEHDRMTNKYLLRFDDTLKEGETSSQPLDEARLFLSWFATLVGTQLEMESGMLSSVPIPIHQDPHVYAHLKSTLNELPDFSTHLKQLFSADEEIAIQYIRASEVYQTAVNIMQTNVTLSFFLLTVSIECLSNKLDVGDGKCDKFISFILSNLPDKSDFPTEDDWRDILKEIYYNHRSGFVHGGKQIPDAVSLADKMNPEVHSKHDKWKRSKNTWPKVV